MTEVDQRKQNIVTVIETMTRAAAILGLLGPGTIPAAPTIGTQTVGAMALSLATGVTGQIHGPGPGGRSYHRPTPVP